MNFPPPFTTQVTPLTLGLSSDFMKRLAPELARDIVAGIDEPELLAASYGLTGIQWNVLSESPNFKALVDQAREEMSGPAGVAERVRRKAAMMIERVGLMDMGTIMGDPRASAATKIDAFNSIKDLAGLSKTQPATSAPGMSGPLIVINVPGPNGEAPKPFIVGELSTEAAA